MKKFLALILVLSLVIGTFAGCSGKKTTKKKKNPTSSSVDTVSSESSDTALIDNEDTNSDEPIFAEDTTTNDISDSHTSEEDPDDDAFEYTAMQKKANEVEEGTYSKLFSDSLTYKGNLVRFANFLRKVKSGKAVTIGFIGGVNTANSESYVGGDSVDENYVTQYVDWLKEEYNNSNISFVSAGYAGMTSVAACMMVQQKILDSKPDIVFLDFAVQDAFNSLGKSNTVAYDNLINRVLGSATKPAVVSLILSGAENLSYSMNALAAKPISTTAEYENAVNRYYQIPTINFGVGAWNTINEIIEPAETGDRPLLSWKTFSLTNLFLSESGHKNLAGCLQYLTTTVNSSLGSIGTSAPAVNAQTYYGGRAYMNGSFTNVSELFTGKNGFKFSSDFTKDIISKYEYKLTENTSTNGSRGPYIVTYRHFINNTGVADNDKYIENPLYMSIDVNASPSVGSIYFIYQTSSSIKKSDIPTIIDHTPIKILCYNDKGNVLKSFKPVVGNYRESTSTGVFVCASLPANTKKIEVRMFVKGGRFEIFGIGTFSN